jgi:FkbM family methyltransferase
MRLRSGVLRFRPRQVRHTYGGFALDIHLADPLGAGWYDHDWPELLEIALLGNHRLKPGARVFDLGAHQCVVALVLAKTVGPTGLVVAVEANPHNAALGQRNRDLNRVEHLHVLQAAAAEHSGTLTFNEGLNGQVDDGTGTWGRLKVRAVSVDDLAREYGIPDVLFIDVEGYEGQVLRGARETLRHRPDCFVEVHVGEALAKFGGSVESILSFFPTSDYELYTATETHGEPTPFIPDRGAPRERFFLIAISRQPPRNNP